MLGIVTSERKFASVFQTAGAVTCRMDDLVCPSIFNNIIVIIMII